MPSLSSTLSSSLTRFAVPLAPRASEGAATVAAGVASAAVARETTRQQPVADAVTVQAAKATGKTPAAALTEQQIEEQVQAMQAKMDKLNPALAFVVDKDTGKAMIRLTDRATKEVILQFPSEAALQITRALDRFAKGQLVDRTA